MVTNRFGEISQITKLIILALLPIAALFGNAPADIGLVLIVLIYLATTPNALKGVVKSHFLQISLIFWLWALFCSAISFFPKHSFQDSLPWIRFPLYAYVLSLLLLEKNGRNFKIFLSSAALGTLIEISVMAYQFIVHRLPGATINPGAARLTGTFERLMAGWYIVCFGLIVTLWCLNTLRNTKVTPISAIGMVAFSVLTAVGMLSSGEMINSIAFIGIVTLALLFRRRTEYAKSAPVLLGLVIVLSALAIFVMMDPGLNSRVTTALEQRLPWLPGSDYYPPLKAGYEIAANNLFYGVGPKNTFTYCEMLKAQGLMDSVLNIPTTQCPWHPHNLYLQFAAETGLPGLFLFVVLAGYILVQSFRHFWRDATLNNLPLAITLVLFFPIQTYSQAFGQSKNFYFWTMVGFSLYLIRTQFKASEQSERL